LEESFKKDDRWSILIELYEFWEARGKALEQQLSDDEKPICECPSCGATTFNLEIMECVLCGHSEDQIECDQCKELFWESEIECFGGVDGDDESGMYSYDVTICKGCIEEEQNEAMYSEYM